MAANTKELQAQRDPLLKSSCEVDDDLEDASFECVYSEKEMKVIPAKNAPKIQEQVAALDAKKKHLEEKCQALQEIADSTRKQNDILKMKTTIAMGSMKLMIDSLKEDKHCLTEKCETFEGKILELRKENASKQNRINKLEVEASRSKEREIRIRDAQHLDMKVKGTRPLLDSDPFSLSSKVSA